MIRRTSHESGLSLTLTHVHTHSQAYFIDLFVRPSNALAVGLYTGLEYSIYRRVKEYYAGGGPDGADEDGYGE